MMSGSIRIRLTAWYAFSLAVILALFAGGAWLAMRASVQETVDKDLRARIEDVREFLRRVPSWAHALRSWCDDRPGKLPQLFPVAH